MTIEYRKIKWGVGTINIADAGVTPDVADPAHATPRRTRDKLRKLGDYIPFVEVNMGECSNWYSINVERGVNEDGTPNFDPLAYEVCECAPVAVPHKNVIRLNEARERFCNAFIKPRNQPEK